MEEVESESKHVWGLFKDILLLPITLILVIFRKKELTELFNPIKDLWNFFWDAKVVAILIIINVLVFGFFIVDDITGNKITGLDQEGEVNEFIGKYMAVSPTHIKEKNFISFFTSWFMHGSLVHLLGNMLGLFILGRVVEKNFGPIKTIAIYFIAATAGSIAELAIHFNELDYSGLGASGAIMGLASAAILAQPFYLTYLFAGIPIPVFLMGWIYISSDIIGVLNPSPESNIGHFAHLGGFFAIMITAFFLSSEDKSKLKKGLMINVITLLIAAGAWFFFIRGGA